MFRNIALIASVVFSLGACGSEDAGGGNGDGGPSGSDRGGPDALSGFSWTSDPMEINGVALQLSFEFTDTELNASNTCAGDVTVTTSAPIRYTYRATIEEGDSSEVSEGGNTCDVSIAPGSFDFQRVGKNLEVSYKDQKLSFGPEGTTSGVFGEWKAEWDLGSLVWSMGDGKLTATNECDNGLSATAQVAADYRNFVVIEEEATGGDESCSVGIQKGNLEYRFEGSELVLIFAGEEIRLKKK